MLEHLEGGNLSAVMITGSIIAVAAGLRIGFSRTVVPPLVGYLLLGVTIAGLDAQTALFSEKTLSILLFLGKLGLVTLLFKVGLESDLAGLLKQLRRASVVWIANVVVCAAGGYLVTWWLGYGLVTSLIVGTAFVATSVGVSVTVWEETGAITSDDGALLLDVAELDDVFAVVLLALLFTIVPRLLAGETGDIAWTLARESGLFVVKLAGFSLACYLFAHFLEAKLTRFVSCCRGAQPVVVVTAAGFIIAAAAGFLGFSLAIGAFFAGLAFSRDPDQVKIDGSFNPIHAMFSPFFFITIGMYMEPTTAVSGMGLGLVLLAAAAATKYAANAGSVWALKGPQSAHLIGASMIPRAEISMIVMARGLELGPQAVPEELFAAMVFVTAATCMAGPLTVKLLLDRFAPSGTGNGNGTTRKST
jgi:Kef-type K+ transport system membrane component KefB